jgi:hypothetical protein
MLLRIHLLWVSFLFSVCESATVSATTASLAVVVGGSVSSPELCCLFVRACCQFRLCLQKLCYLLFVFCLQLLFLFCCMFFILEFHPSTTIFMMVLEVVVPTKQRVF